MERRSFIKKTCSFCLLGAAGAALVDIAGCSPGAKLAAASFPVNNNKVSVPVSLFEASSLQVISPKKYPYEIAVQKKSDGSFSALLLKCTHFDNQVVPDNNGYTCHFHGSHFDQEGAVTKGPASAPLTALKTQLTNTDIIIELI